MPLQFQYGSNCSEERLNSPERLNGGARYDGRAQSVDQYEIAFDVWSRGNGCAAADLRAVETREQHVWGVLYQVTDEGFGRLGQVEGPRYEEKSIKCSSSRAISLPRSLFEGNQPRWAANESVPAAEATV
jgi:Gamma-glutamyl cyclotransferase, AIG2-like